MLTHPQDLDAQLHVAARKKIHAYRAQYASNRNITFMPAITSTSSRMHGEFLRLLFLQARFPPVSGRREGKRRTCAKGLPAAACAFESGHLTLVSGAGEGEVVSKKVGNEVRGAQG